MSTTATQVSQPLLKVSNLTVCIEALHHSFYAVQNLSFDIHEGKTVALVGESGSGKTITALTLLGLLPKSARRVGGEIWCCGDRVTSQTKDNLNAGVDWMHLRGKTIACIFQDPHSALNPVFRVGRQIQDVVQTHFRLSAKIAKRQTIEMLEKVGLARAEQVFSAYPHQLSGGMAQRVIIAMALCCRPKVIIADEPTNALDITTQTQILKLIGNLQADYQFGLLLISHDLDVVSKLAERTVVLRFGEMVEDGPTEDVLRSPKHPYTRSLVEATFRSIVNRFS